MKTIFKMPYILYGIVLIGLCNLSLYSCNSNNENTADQSGTPTQAQMVEQGKYLVQAMGCLECHNPMIRTAQGFVRDSSRFLAGSGYNAASQMPAIDTSIFDKASKGERVEMYLPLNAYAGKWGISFPANLTPDSTTGIGGWTSDIFIRAIRYGKYQGVLAARSLMPPMPWQAYRNLSDQDLQAIFAYLQTIPAVHNQVHPYIPFNQITVKN